MKNEFNKDTEILKNNQIEMKSQHPPQKSSVESITVWSNLKMEYHECKKMKNTKKM
jgi:hypothetical protein